MDTFSVKDRVRQVAQQIANERRELVIQGSAAQVATQLEVGNDAPLIARLTAAGDFLISRAGQEPLTLTRETLALWREGKETTQALSMRDLGAVLRVFAQILDIQSRIAG